jgi:hypothetical protein
MRRLDAEQQEFGRQRPLARIDRAVDPGDIGANGRSGAVIIACIAARRDAIEIERGDQLVHRQPVGAHGLGETRPARTARHFELPQPILRMDIAEPEKGIGPRASEDMRHSLAIAHDLHIRADAVERDRA